MKREDIRRTDEYKKYIDIAKAETNTAGAISTNEQSAKQHNREISDVMGLDVGGKEGLGASDRALMESSEKTAEKVKELEAQFLENMNANFDMGAKWYGSKIEFKTVEEAENFLIQVMEGRHPKIKVDKEKVQRYGIKLMNGNQTEQDAKGLTQEEKSISEVMFGKMNTINNKKVASLNTLKSYPAFSELNKENKKLQEKLTKTEESKNKLGSETKYYVNPNEAEPKEYITEKEYKVLKDGSAKQTMKEVTLEEIIQDDISAGKNKAFEKIKVFDDKKHPKFGVANSMLGMMCNGLNGVVDKIIPDKLLPAKKLMMGMALGAVILPVGLPLAMALGGGSVILKSYIYNGIANKIKKSKEKSVEMSKEHKSQIEKIMGKDVLQNMVANKADGSELDMSAAPVTAENVEGFKKVGDGLAKGMPEHSGGNTEIETTKEMLQSLMLEVKNLREELAGYKDGERSISEMEVLNAATSPDAPKAPREEVLKKASVKAKETPEQKLVRYQSKIESNESFVKMLEGKEDEETKQIVEKLNKSSMAYRMNIAKLTKPKKDASTTSGQTQGTKTNHTDNSQS